MSDVLSLPPTPEPVRRFIIGCALAALAWLVVGIPLSFHFFNVTYDDFQQFYMGGLVARHHAWDALYPTPRPDSPFNPGLPDDSFAKPEYERLSHAAQVAENPERFIQPPPDALLFVPFSLFKYLRARRLFMALMGLCAWGGALLCGRAYALCVGRATRGAGWCILLAALAPATYGTLRALNLEAALEFLIAASVVGVIERRTIRAGVALGLGAVLKYASLVLLPLWIAMRQWRPIIASLLLIALAFGVTRIIAGPAPFHAFFHDIAPRLDRAYSDTPNVSLYGLLMRLTGTTPLAKHWATGERAVAGVALLAIFVLLLRRSADEYAHEPALVLAGASLLLGWLLIFAPLVWNKYHLMMAPFWGYFVWEATRSRGRAIAVIIALLLVVGHWHMLPARDLSEPINSHMLWGVIVLSIIAAMRVARRPATQTQTNPSP